MVKLDSIRKQVKDCQKKGLINVATPKIKLDQEEGEKVSTNSKSASANQKEEKEKKGPVFQGMSSSLFVEIDQIDGVKLRDFSELGGYDEQKSKLIEIAKLYREHIQDFKLLGLEEVTKIVLLTGPVGAGKSTFARAFCKEVGFPCKFINCVELVSGITGQLEARIRNLVEEAIESSPCTIVFEDLDVIANDKHNQASKEGNKRRIYQIKHSLDELMKEDIVVVVTSSKSEDIDSTIKRPGKIDKEISIGMPNAIDRADILEHLLKDVKTELDNYYELGEKTTGYVCSDLVALVSQAAHYSLLRSFSKEIIDRKNIVMIKEDFELAMKEICPISKKTGFSNIPTTTWDDIGALNHLKKELKNAIIKPLKNPERCRQFNIRFQAGILLYGPPGCGKTMLAKAVANSTGANFIAVKGPELMNKYVGESEKAVRSLFQR